MKDEFGLALFRLLVGVCVLSLLGEGMMFERSLHDASASAATVGWFIAIAITVPVFLVMLDRQLDLERNRGALEMLHKILGIASDEDDDG